MATRSLKAMGFILACGVLANMAEAEDKPLSPLAIEAKARVESAIEFTKKNNYDMKIVQEALINDPRFRNDENHQYIFMYIYNSDEQQAICIGHGQRLDLIGRNVWSIRTPAGTLFFQDNRELFDNEDEFWLEYEWLNPNTNIVETKNSFLKKIIFPEQQTVWIGCGFWKGPRPDDSTTSSIDSKTRTSIKKGLDGLAQSAREIQHVILGLLSDHSFQKLPGEDATHSAISIKAKEIVEAAHAFAMEHAQDMNAVQAALETDPQFRDDEHNLYIFMHAFNVERQEVICIGQGIKPELVGTNMWALRTPNGRYPFHEMIDLFQEHDEFWLEYDWLNPKTKTVETKRSFFKKILLPDGRNAWIGCGYWKGSSSGNSTGSSLPGNKNNIGDTEPDHDTVHAGNPTTDRTTDETPLSPEARKTKAIVEAAHAFVTEHAQDMKIVQAALETDPRFRDDQNHLYIFMHAYNRERREAICIGHGVRSDIIGKNMWSMRTPTGRLLFQEEIELFQDRDEFWLEYEWLNPHTKTIGTKRSFFKKIVLPDNQTAWVGCGYWKD